MKQRPDIIALRKKHKWLRPICESGYKPKLLKNIIFGERFAKGILEQRSGKFVRLSIPDDIWSKGIVSTASLIDQTKIKRINVFYDPFTRSEIWEIEE
jgi:hypothetical protein